MVNWKSKKTGDMLLLATGIVALLLMNILSSQFFFRLDLTEERRYTIHNSTRDMLENLDDEVYVEVFLEGELNAGFRRFQKAIRETLETFRIYSGNSVQYSFTDPATALSQKARSEFMADLASKGIQPTNVIDTREGERVEKIIFPGVVISYSGAEKGVMLLKGNKAGTPEEEINQSIEGIEFEIANAIHKLAETDPKQIGMVSGHGELDGLSIASFDQAVSELYHTRRVNLGDRSLSDFEALVIAKPTMPFSETDKYRLDQYIMQGGKVLFLLDRLDASMDSATQATHFAIPYETRLDDQLFRYGTRINPDLLQDRYASRYPVITGQRPDGTAQIQLMDWPFFPLINRFPEHPITHNLDMVLTRFVSSIDTVKAAGVTKTPLMLTSQYSRKLTAPVNVNINELRDNLTAEQFTEKFIPVAWLLEGTFTSLFKNRFLPEGAEKGSFREESEATSLIVVSDGDLARNEINRRTGLSLPLGFDPFTNYTFANQDLLLNMISYLVDENGLIRARNKEIRIRPLDRERIAAEKLKWQVTNLGLPLAILVVFGMVRSHWRKRKFANF
ncbi:MAG: gliding motility-associated ABC transporter substrate-binding protein GldG [Cyclobacteriaceae bacterium]